MADFDDSNEKKGPSAEDMSLADLLGADDSPPASTAHRVDSRDDEPDSGMVRLADMVAKSSRVPSIAPPAATADSADTSPVAAAPTAVQQPFDDMAGRPSLTPTIPPDPRKPTFPVIIAIATVVIVVGAAVAFFIIQKRSAEEAERIMQLRMQVEELEKKKQRDEMQAKMEELQRKEQEAQKRAEEEKAAAEKAAAEKAALEKALAERAAEEEEEQAQEEEVEEPETTATKKGKKKKSNRSKKKAKKANKAKKTKTTEAVASGGNWTKTTESSPPKKTDELDDLIGGSKKSKDKPAAAASGGGKPTKAQVRAAMAPVSAKAQSCSRYSTGTVQLRITVASNGKVKQSKAIGSFANTTAGKCVEMIARTAKFDSFSDPSFTFTYPITLR